MSRALALPLLDQVRIASPCPMKWEHMTAVGDGERTRYCGQCALNVHNISDMTRDEAEDFLRSVVPGQRVCGAFWRRADGTIMTRDCPVGLRAARLRLTRIISRVAAVGALVLTGAVFARSRSAHEWRGAGLASMSPFSILTQWVRGKPAPPPPQPVPGEISLPLVPTTTKTGPTFSGGRWRRPRCRGGG